MKKMKFIYMLLTLTLMSCGNNEITDLDEQEFDEVKYGFKSGELLTRTFEVNGQVVAEIEDSLINFGTQHVLAIFPITERIHAIDDEYKKVFRELTKDKLLFFIELWGSSFGMENEVVERKFIHFLDYINTYSLDGTLLCDLVLKDETEMSALKKVLDVSNSLTRSGATSINLNDIFYYAYNKNVKLSQMINTIEETGVSFDTYMYSVYNNTPVVNIKTKGAAKDIVNIFKGATELAKFWIDFADKNGPVVDFQDNYISVLNSADTNPDNYVVSNSSKTDTYTLNYHVNKIWYAKTSFYIKCDYNGVNKSFAGKYIPSIVVMCEKAAAGGPEFSVNGKTSFSPAMNSGTFDEPVANVQGCVSVDYGDCCCFHYYSYLNFTVRGDNGITIDSFSNGRD